MGWVWTGLHDFDLDVVGGMDELLVGILDEPVRLCVCNDLWMDKIYGACATIRTDIQEHSDGATEKGRMCECVCQILRGQGAT